jgi:hypothetical protein
MKLSNLLHLCALATTSAGMIIHDLRNTSATTQTLDKRNSYALGVNLFTNGGCAGANVGFANHDAKSCDFGWAWSGGYQWVSSRVKPDGTQGGHGCMTIWEDEGCGGQDSARYQSFVLQPNACLSFDFSPKCIVVGSTDNGCNARRNTC